MLGLIEAVDSVPYSLPMHKVIQQVHNKMQENKSSMEKLDATALS